MMWLTRYSAAVVFNIANTKPHISYRGKYDIELVVTITLSRHPCRRQMNAGRLAQQGVFDVSNTIAPIYFDSF